MIRTAGEGPSPPLAGQTVVVTRPREQAEELALLLESAGARVECIAAIRIVDPSSWQALDRAIGALSSYDGILFTSANAVSRFLARARAQGARLSGPSIYAVGPRTARVLREGGIEPVVASDHRAEGVLALLGDVRGKRFLFPRARHGRELLPRAIAAGGGSVDVVVAYETLAPEGELQRLRTLLRAEEVDCLVFLSPSAVRHLVEALGENASLPPRTRIAVIGPTTARAAAAAGWIPSIQPAEASAEALARAILESSRDQ